MNITVLVDFENDSVRTALEVAEALGTELWGVRLDTSEQLVDRSLQDEMGGFKPDRRQPAAGREGPRRARRRRLHGACGSWPAAASTPQRIREFEAAGVPVDAYGVGSSLIRGENDFTADVVMRRRKAVREGRDAATRQSQPRKGSVIVRGWLGPARCAVADQRDRHGHTLGFLGYPDVALWLHDWLPIIFMGAARGRRCSR